MFLHARAVRVIDHVEAFLEWDFGLLRADLPRIVVSLRLGVGGDRGDEHDDDQDGSDERSEIGDDAHVDVLLALHRTVRGGWLGLW